MTNAENKKELFFNILKDVFVGAKVEGYGGFINLMKIKSIYYEKLKEVVEKDIAKILQKYPDFEDELFDKLYTFFRRYFSENGCIFFASTPFHNNVYERIYTDKDDVVLFWKTKDLYYIKTDRLFRSMQIEVDGKRFFFNAQTIENKKNNERRELFFVLKGIEKDGTIVFDVYYQEGNKKTDIDEIRKTLKKQGIFISEEDLQFVFSTFKKQSEVDYFLHKNPRYFLKEQFKLWLHNYLWDSGSEIPEERVNQLFALKDIAYKIIDFIAQFEEELVKIWLKPRFVLNSNYVITLDRIANKEGGIEIISRILNHPNIQEQIQEWRELNIVDENFKPEEILQEGSLNDRYKFLPIDTKYFKDLEIEILSLFDNLDEELDGWLIKSENFQALNTILPKFKGKVQTIYIDPPFNLESSDQFLYRTNYKDSTWATMLHNRLELAKEFLKDTGSIFVRCDYNGNWIVRPLMDEIFGRENFRNEIIIKRKRQPMGTPNKFEVENEYLIYYAKSSKGKIEDVFEKRQVERIKWTGFLKQGDRNPPQRVFMGKLLYPPKGQHFSLNQEKVDKLLREHYLRLKCKKCGCVYYFDEENSYADFYKKIDKNDYKYKGVNENKVFGVSNIDKCILCGSDDWKVEYLPSEVRKLGNLWLNIPSYADNNSFSTENSEVLISYVIQATSKPSDLVMDFFLGSGTTTAVAHKLKRKWIGIEMGEHFYSVVLPRMKKVLAYDKSGISKDEEVRKKYNKESAGGFFKYYALEQFEEILNKVSYQEKYVCDDNVFIADLKLLSSADITEDEAIIRLNEIYENIDLQESLSNLSGKPIKKVEKVKDEVELKTVKEFVWWE